MASFDYMAVAAIDFGTTFSGYAFATINDLKKDPTKTFAPNWHAADGGLVSSKTPTTVLLDKDEKLVDFGFDAETRYAEISENEEHEEYFYFRRFKMMLYDKVRKDLDKPSKLTIDTTISDIRGRKLKALAVFSHAIRYLKDHLLKSLKDKGSIVKEEEILWVLTVPAIWDHTAKLFMRKAAEKAQIPGHQLMIALEPEAASIYCKHLPVEKLKGSNSISAFQPGSKYLVLDAGGGTIDITVHEVQGNRNLKELVCASGGNWGGTSVDMAFKRALEEIVTKKMVDDYCQKYTGDYIEFLRDFEIKKRKCGIRNDSNPMITLKVPVTFVDECENKLGKDLTTLTNQSRFSNQFLWKSDKVRIDLSTFEGFFKPACDAIIEHVRGLFKSTKVKGVKKILMVGGFSESPLLQDAIRKAFPNCQVIVPQDAGLAVLRGAVVFSHNPETIESRIAQYTYGVGTNVDFDPDKHMESKKKVIDGKEYCTDIFDSHVHEDDELLTNVAQSEEFYSPLTQQQKRVGFNIYTSKNGKPLYIDNCENIGSFSVDIPQGAEEDRSVSVKMIFGKQELTAEATVVKTGKITPGVFELPEEDKIY